MLNTFCLLSSSYPTLSCLLPYLLTESGLSVNMQKEDLEVVPGEKLRLVCNADGIKGQLSVTWEHKPTESALFTSIISLNQNGVTEKGEAFKSREVRVTRPTIDTFVFELYEVKESESGIYTCTVSETQPNGNIQSQIQHARVTVKSIGKICIFFLEDLFKLNYEIYNFLF